jgi:hypothetical protein
VRKYEIQENKDKDVFNNLHFVRTLSSTSRRAEKQAFSSCCATCSRWATVFLQDETPSMKRQLGFYQKRSLVLHEEL